MERYDYIFAGAGCAGLSLLYYLLESDLKDAKILLIDPLGKSVPNKTWCYWAEKPLEIHPPDKVHFWNNLNFTSQNKKITKSLDQLNYYHLNSHDFYSSIFEKLKDRPNVTFLQDEVIEITENEDNSSISTRNHGKFTTALIFDSRLRKENFKATSNLKQIFAGWRIKTESPVFDSKSLTLMEFPKKESGKFDFFYILPFAENEALIEYTAYSQAEISENELQSALTDYLHTLIGDSSYSITFSESGVIPMSTQINPSKTSSRIIPLGTTAGWTKASTGYTFHTIQKNCKAIVDALCNGKLSEYRFERSARFSFYDNILLNIAHKWPERLQELFLNLFETSPANQVLLFLNEETTFTEELQLLGKLRFPIFIKSLLNYEAH